MWSCPCCSAKIQAERTDELVAVVEEAHRQGLKVAMATLTMRHRKRRRLKPMWDALSDAFAAATSGDRAVHKAWAALGAVGWVRRVEATHGVNGWHLHVHVLIFYRLDGALDQLGDAMWTGWIRRLHAHGLDADRDHGLDLRELDLEQARAEAGRYLTKATYDGTAAAGRELAGQLGKSGRNGSRTPFEVLSDLTRDGLAADLAIWSEWERASKGRRAMSWSKGLRDRLGTAPERSDEEIAADNDGDQVDIASFGSDVHALLVARRLEDDLLEAVEAVPIPDSFAAVERFFDVHGFPPPRRPPRPPEARS